LSSTEVSEGCAEDRRADPNHDAEPTDGAERRIGASYNKKDQ
jgi:hypothetical protein